jgi:hypothetical protein
MKRACCVVLIGAACVSSLAQVTESRSQSAKPAQTAATDTAPRTPGHQQAPRPATGSARYSSYAAAGGYSHQHESFWSFWLRQFNPRNIDYGAWIEERRQMFLRQAGENPYFWFCFWELAALCFLFLWIAKERMDRKDMEWEAAGCMADLANYADYCKRDAQEAIRRHNEHVEVCNRVIESAETGRPMNASGNEEQWKAELERLRIDLAEKTADNSRLKAELEQRSATVADLSTRVDELAKQSGKANAGSASPNLDLVARVNRLTTEVQALRDENSRLKRANQNASSGERVR